ncbi:UMP kinase [Xanthobacter sp. VNH20]|jgi:uridylate kinase|uniref:UMP kinase n=1 Tax=Xanthobacteraceae TaxID=335928 RepID=UPI000BC69FD8|nr:MAG: UMP kinase [Rhizobiales bacterium 12-66-7]OYX74762.1 MAG: UMP kinase [Rhizobiales bacterium 32-66-11]OYZ67731.1 MAG: UMP kinase [Rhizobiales bacterium 24-66-13]HQS09254.1 UMP kinase [Xanthobacteraceae bacterium]HQS47458.1 UMP kinase [Xanthobacteraceae bacterium]
MSDLPYPRVLIKVSGEALMGPEPFGLHPPTVTRIARDLVAVRALGCEVAVVVGGGNILRGARVAGEDLNRSTADHMGMLATVMNCLALEQAVEAAGEPARTMSAIPMPTVCEPYARQPAMRHLRRGRIVLLAGGTGNPYFTTDTGAVLRAAELSCDAVLKATNVDGVYTADPKLDPNARRYDRLTHDQALAYDLKVMDAAAFALAREAALPIIVFSIREPGAIVAAAKGEGHVTVVAP